jgi:hypothetical protein
MMLASAPVSVSFSLCIENLTEQIQKVDMKVNTEWSRIVSLSFRFIEKIDAYYMWCLYPLL